MKTSNSICIALFIFSKIVCGARGEDYRTDINPALLYYQAFLLAPKDEDLQYLNTNDWWKGWWRGERLNDEFGSGVSNTAAELELSRQAAHQTVACDWGIDLSQGPRTLLPQLARAKRTVIDSQYQIMWDLQIGNQAGARDDLLADLTLGRNISQDRTLISVLVEMAIESFACNEIAENIHRFSPETLQRLADGFDAAPPRGTVAECVFPEQSMRDWYLRSIQKLKEQYPDDSEGAIDGLHKFLDYYSSEDWEQLTNAAGGTVDGVAREIRDAEPLYAKLGKIMALPYSEYEGQLKYDSRPDLLKAQFEKSGNPFFIRFVSNWQRCRHREFRREVDLAMVRAAIEYKLHGEAGLKTIADPCGDGPFAFQRFVFNGADRGFELKSTFFQARDIPEAYIFVESAGTPFNVTGIKVGQPVTE
ncbi:MAG TPA: hypothetical protein VGJ73_11525 [Verrucomicrobiae bacterium]|jgi:hypothetical protein